MSLVRRGAQRGVGDGAQASFKQMADAIHPSIGGSAATYVLFGGASQLILLFLAKWAGRLPAGGSGRVCRSAIRRLARHRKCRWVGWVAAVFSGTFLINHFELFWGCIRVAKQSGPARPIAARCGFKTGRLLYKVGAGTRSISVSSFAFWIAAPVK